MVDILWQKQYSVGVIEIDDQHKKLFEMLQELQSSLNNEHTNIVVNKILKELVKYTQIHFRDEERLMLQIKYNDYVNHSKKHVEFVDTIKRILMCISKGEDFTAHDLMDILKHWLIDHVMNEDMKVGKALQSKLVEAMRVTSTQKVH